MRILRLLRRATDSLLFRWSISRPWRRSPLRWRMGFLFGQAVTIAGANLSAYNGTFSIASVPSPSSFNYAMASPPGSDASGAFTFGALWQQSRLVIENNIIELVLRLYPPGGGYAS